MPDARNEFGQPVGDPVPGWTPRPLPPRTPMRGRFCRVEPVDPDRDTPGLYAAFSAAPDERAWTYLPSGRPSTPEAFRGHVERLAATDDPFHHTITELATDRPVGTASLMRMDPANGVIEIGWINYSPWLQRTPAATEAMYLFARRVFDELGYRRYEWKCHSLNAPSRAAAVRFGFTFEGVFRQAAVTKGRNRDTAWYSMLDHEWPAIRRGYEAWLDPANFTPDGAQRERLADCMGRHRG
jgi:RimJ/RimL family protein N-acetyltransferase